MSTNEPGGYVAILVGWVLVVVLAATPALAGDSLLYYSKDGRVVVTNTPSHEDARPVPGFAETRTPVRVTSRLPATPYDPYIDIVAAEYGLSADLIKAVVQAESGFNPKAVSPKGAMGLMQLMPATARELGVEDPFDPLQNLRGGAIYLGHLLHRFDGDVTLALAAYNAGEGAVRRHGGVPAYRETQNYVRKIQGRLGQSPDLPARRPRGAAGLRVIRHADGSVEIKN